MIVAVSFPTARHKLVDSITGKEFTQSLDNNVLHVWDVIDDATIQQIVDTFGKPKYIVMDSFSFYKTALDIPVYYIDAWIENQIKQAESMQVQQVDKLSTEYTANFIVNKKQINRFLAIKLCEVFNVNANYTWSGIGKEFDLSDIVNEKQQLKDPVIDDHWSDILSPISKFEKKWYSTHGEKFSSSGVDSYGNNITVWNQYLIDIVSRTAISIITESVHIQQAATFTEKTAYAMLGLTFPIWVGGVNSAFYWQDKGFDVFDDVIDHSYQNRPTLLERCFYAFYLNRNLLTDTEKVSALRKQHLGRLIKNRSLLTSNTFKSYNQRIVQQWPNDLQIPANNSIIQYLRRLDGYI